MPNNGPGTTLQTGGKSPLAAVVALVLAVLTAGSVAMIGVTSFTAFNPPGWVRIVSMAPLPFALAGSIAFAVVGLRQGLGRTQAILALILDGVAVSAFVVMLSVGG